MQLNTNLNRVMEAETILKNAASPKSQRSRGNFLMVGVLMFACFFAVNAYSQCTWSGNGTSSSKWDISDKSTTGNSVWAYISGSILYIEGSGNMADFWSSAQGEAPWRCANRQNEIITVVFQSGSNVKNIGNRAFKDCQYLQNITIPNSVLYINEQAFLNCTSLQSITIPNSVLEIRGEAFKNCSSLKTLIIDKGSNTLKFNQYYISGNEIIRDLGDKRDWFKGCPIQTLYLGRNYYYHYDSPFNGMPMLQTLTIWNTVTYLGVDYYADFAFRECYSLTNVTIEDGTSTLSCYSAFYNCPIKTLHLGRNISCTANPFENKKSLETLTIGDKVTSIGHSMFEGCINLTTITIPASVTSIGSYAFAYCGLTEIRSLRTTAPTAGSYCFHNRYCYCTLYIPQGSGNSYRSQSEWEKFFDCKPPKVIEGDGTTNSIDDTENDKINIFPNPVKDELHIVGAYGIRPDETVQIVDLTGRVVLSGVCHTPLRINVAHLPSGVYILKVGNYTKKFTKE